MPSIEGLRLKLRAKYINLTKKNRRKKINIDNFTIISNNCWAGFIYQSYGLPYNTPTVGLFIMAEDYIKFVSDLKRYINCSLKFINYKDSKWYDYQKNKAAFGTYPIARLDDIEIHFLHYKTEEEAREKWTRRCQRINWDKLIVKFNDQNGCVYENLADFDKLPYKNKVCFTVADYPNLHSVVYVKAPKSHKYIRASYEPFGKSKSIDMNKFINEL
jgi:uncharacterized protein (DUF1919 family)